MYAMFTLVMGLLLPYCDREQTCDVLPPCHECCAEAICGAETICGAEAICGALPCGFELPPELIPEDEPIPGEEVCIVARDGLQCFQP